MTKQINFFLLLAIIAVFTACNNANKSATAVSKTTSDTPTMTAKEIAMSDIQKQNVQKGDIGNKSDLAAKNASGSTSSQGGLSPDNVNNSAKVSKTDADRMRQRVTEQGANVQNTRSNSASANVDPNKAAKLKEMAAAKEKATVKNTNVPTPTMNTRTVETPTEVAGAPTHEDWNALLTSNVSSTGKVNYSGFKGAQSKLNTYLDKLRNNPPTSDWTRNEKMAFWINAYNAFTVKKIVDNYPLGSIQELSGGKVWDDKWINIGDKTYSLNDIENGILRPTYKDARIHFAVNCAAKSCPSLHNRAFTADNLESTLAKQTKKFVNNPDFNTITENKVTVSKIFDWYSADFGDLRDFLNEYSNTKINDNATVDYTEYNWSLNE